ncbi:hypothetical protein BDA99DRAFT_542555 [Phascolomyces articulosus]|uniref:Uncharacterized protein n=1 Tax=Phascolomyces articulosus TaxID=60185 RepID=A0AAD5K0P9_9FUNG|nr:hypothetical protein BDA99DRAFT_542555 [Phascolomyces articulosus]
MYVLLPRNPSSIRMFIEISDAGFIESGNPLRITCLAAIGRTFFWHGQAFNLDKLGLTCFVNKTLQVPYESKDNIAVHRWGRHISLNQDIMVPLLNMVSYVAMMATESKIIVWLIINLNSNTHSDMEICYYVHKLPTLSCLFMRQINMVQ